MNTFVAPEDGARVGARDWHVGHAPGLGHDDLKVATSRPNERSLNSRTEGIGTLVVSVQVCCFAMIVLAHLLLFEREGSLAASDVMFSLGVFGGFAILANYWGREPGHRILKDGVIVGRLVIAKSLENHCKVTSPSSWEAANLSGHAVAC